MSANATSLTPPGRPAWSTISRQNLEVALLWFTMAISGFVLFEPAPFEFMVLILVGIWLLSGLHIPRSIRPLIAFLGILTVTGLVAAWLSTTLVGSARHVAISIFLYILALGLAAYVARNPKKSLPIIMSGYTVAAIVACLAAVAGYFSLVDGASDLFLSHSRARGTLKDPNVFGPFITVPMIYIFVRHLVGEEKIGGWKSAILGFLAFGLLLSFSRGAWANLVFAVGIATYLIFISARSNSLRLKVLGLTVCLGVIAAFLLVVALSFDAISDLMNVRGKFLQSYDTSERFVGAAVALEVIFNNPIGIGALSFKDFHSVEPHNVYLYSFLIGGWLGGFAYIGLVVSTLYIGLRASLRESSVRLYAIVFFSNFLSTALEGLIIDSDHWRHFYILIACLWGIHAYIARERRQSRMTPPEPARDKTKLPAQPTERMAMIRHPRLRHDLNRSSTKTTDAAVTANPLPAPKPSKVDLDFTPNTVLRRAWRRKLGTLKARNKIPKQASTPTITPEADRSQFGIRPADVIPARNTFGRRTTH